VGGVMIIVIVGWVFFLRAQVTNDLGKGGGFQEISDRFGDMFDKVGEGVDNIGDTLSNKLETVDTESSEEIETEKEKQIRELEEKVFPQFENINSNTNNP
jgi:hypothetical protein